ncbi:MAG: ATPase, T2SS/T4P/T4SS family [Patescibacteria group bacterium]
MRAQTENTKLRETLLKDKILSEAQIKVLEKKLQTTGKTLTEQILEDRLLSEQILFEAVANSYGVPFVDLSNETIRRDILELVPEPIVQVHQVVAFERDESTVKLAMLDPTDLQTLEFIEKKTGLTPEVHVTTQSSVQSVLKQYHKGLKAELKEISGAKNKDEEEGAPKEKDLKQLAEDLPVVRIVDTLLEYAILEGASDIHIEPLEKETIVRYRIDGVLREVMNLPKNVHNGVIARIKILSNLKLDEHRLPQDGRFKITTAEHKVAFRVSILPIYDGEKIVLRLLDESAKVLTLEQLGMQPKPLEILKRAISKPHGIIYVTGPTGSGKTTTLYTIVNILNTPSVNISTIEDPVEYRMQRVNQTQVSPKIGLTFAAGLRSLLRQDPNIIMVGEIRDKETAEIANHAAMTGHIVLTTLHTNDAVTTLPRLAKMGVPNFLIASTTNLVMAQRLVRKICVHCVESYTLTKKQIEELGQQINVSELLQILDHEGAVDLKKQNMEELLFYRGKGCKQCNDTGYKGRIGIYEVVEMTDEIAQRILDNASTSELTKTAIAQGMLTMLQDGFIKAKSGITSIEEVLRVTQE